MPSATLKGGETLPFGHFELKVLLTTGHSIGHICLYEPKEKLMLSGDHAFADSFSLVNFLPGYGENPLGDYINSF